MEFLVLRSKTRRRVRCSQHLLHGTLNSPGQVEVTAAAGDSSLARLAALMERAAAQRSSR